MSKVIELAKQAGLCLANDEKPLIERFAALVRNAAMDEAKQKILDFQAGWVPDGFTECAAAIESLKEPTP